jgi:NhaA family Na+:H+ antiporter
MKKIISSEIFPGILLLAVAAFAMILANSSLSDFYFDLLNFKIGSLSLQLWVNDALMVIFFFLVGMEIKRELITGELSSVKKASLPFFAALGGMIVPALIYVYMNPEYPDKAGWGIPMATDIAFALGALSLLSKRVPASLKVFLMALAVIDDLGAILVIAFFYTTDLKLMALGFASFGLLSIIILQVQHVRSYLIYILIGAGIWSAFLISGIHATIAGVLIGLMTPLKFRDNKRPEGHYSPLTELVHKIHPWSQFFIMPVFAFFNAGVALGEKGFSELVSNPINEGVFLGLSVGKPIGITLFCMVAVTLKFSSLPREARWSHIFGVGMIAGIGFTMSLFISSLSMNSEQEIYSKTGILIGSLISGVLGYLCLRFWPHKKVS